MLPDPPNSLICFDFLALAAVGPRQCERLEPPVSARGSDDLSISKQIRLANFWSELELSIPSNPYFNHHKILSTLSWSDVSYEIIQ